MPTRVINQFAPKNFRSAPYDILVVEWGFEARAPDELTIKEGDELFMLTDRTDDWVPARLVRGPQADVSRVPSGLVPYSYLKKPPPMCRGSARYEYRAENENCVDMDLGQKVDVYLNQGKWALVKLDRFGGRSSAVGYVPGNYVESSDGSEMELSKPSALREQPHRYCYLCQSSIRHITYFECTQCRLPNGDPFDICRDCAYRREAIFVHQAVKGEDHLFSRGMLFEGGWSCDRCLQMIDGASYTCLTCPVQMRDPFDLCNRCYNAPSTPRHKHRMTPVSAEGTLLESQVSTLPKVPSLNVAYICDGCHRDIPRYVLHCKTCPNAGYTLCLECAEFDRATFLHDRWTGGVPHEFQIVDRSNHSQKPA